MTVTIKVAEAFSRVPAGRFAADGPLNGTRFRQEHLLPALRRNQQVIIDIDGLLSYANSFFDEAIAGLCRARDERGEGLDAADVIRLLRVQGSSGPSQFWMKSILRVLPGLREAVPA